MAVTVARGGRSGVDAKKAPAEAGAGVALVVRRIPGLDGLRGVAVLAVLVHHFVELLPGVDFLPGGFLGVDLFMVLSGYLITGIVVGVLDRPRWAAGFYRRRAVRILPALLAMLTLVVLLDGIGVLGQRGDLPGTVVAVVLYAFNYAKAGGLDASVYLNHLWSLAVEEQFYVVWPFLLAIVAPARRVPLAVALTVVVVALRCLAVIDGADLAELHTLAHARADTFLIGALLFLAPGWRQTMARFPRAGLVVFGCSLFVVYPYTAGLESIGLVVIAIACAAMVAGVVEGAWVPGWLTWRPLTTTGLVSYGLYLWHYPVMFWVGGDLGWSGPTAVILATVVSGVATAASWWLVERPAARLASSGWVPRSFRLAVAG